MVINGSSHHSKIQSDFFNKAIADGLIQLYTENEQLTGRYIILNGRGLLNFGSCGYLGIEYDGRIKKSIIEATEKFGSQFSSSRIYASLEMYKELEHLLSQIFQSPVIATASTTLGHLSLIPLLIQRQDAVIMDRQVHASVQMAVQLLQSNNIHTETIRHSNLTMLEERIKALKNKHQKVWYMLDGVYSMYGDAAPVKELETLFNKYEQLHAYVDDAHGMSWTGENGRGFVLSHLSKNHKLYIATSLNKSFAGSGGALILPNEEIEAKTRILGRSLVFSGPISAPMLGANIASAKIHLSNDCEKYQSELHEKIIFAIEQATIHKIPLANRTISPIFFIAIGKAEIAFELASRLMNRGFYTNISFFPAVPLNRAGVRFTITRHLTLANIEHFIRTVSELLLDLLKENNHTIEKIYQTFNIDLRGH